MSLHYDESIAEESRPDALAELRAEKVSLEAELRALAIRFKKGWPIPKNIPAAPKVRVSILHNTSATVNA